MPPPPSSSCVQGLGGTCRGRVCKYGQEDPARLVMMDGNIDTMASLIVVLTLG